MMVFKQCTKCNQKWQTSKEFLLDTEIVFIGYQAHFKRPPEGLFLFNHSCNSTMSISVNNIDDFFNLYSKLIPFTTNHTSDCKGFCGDPFNLETCNSKTCSGVKIREMIKLIQDYKK